LVSSVFLFQNCATLIIGTSQKIPVTSNPPGATIIVNGFVAGHAPMILKLERKKKIHVIRIESPGYNPLEIRMVRKSSPALSVLGNMVFGGLGLCGGFITGLALLILIPHDFESGGPDKGKTLVYSCAIGYAILAWLGAIYKDYKSGANYSLSPAQLNVTLEKQEGEPQPDLILLDARQFGNIKWIRIRCAYSDGKDS